MSAITNLQSILNYKVSDGRSKLQVFVNERKDNTKNAIFLFYTDESEYVNNNGANYYNTSIQCSVRHNYYDTARTAAYNAIEYLNARRKSSNYYYRPITAPRFVGVDDRTGGHVWSFNIIMQGGN